MKNIKEELETLLYDYGAVWTDALADRLINEFHLEFKEMGHWTYHENYDIYSCSNCKQANIYPSKYCPECGAKMEEHNYEI